MTTVALTDSILMTQIIDTVVQEFFAAPSCVLKNRSDHALFLYLCVVRFCVYVIKNGQLGSSGRFSIASVLTFFLNWTPFTALKRRVLSLAFVLKRCSPSLALSTDRCKKSPQQSMC